MIISLFINATAKADIFPVAASYDGVGGVYGVAYAKNFGSSRAIVGGVGGDLIAYGGLYTKFFGKKFELSLGAAAFDQVGLTTTYERGLIKEKENNLYVLNLKGNAYSLGSKLWLFNDYLVFGISATRSVVQFDSYEDSSQNEIDTAGANLFDVETTDLKLSMNLKFYDNPRRPTKGVGLFSSVSSMSGRTGQSDQMIVNYGGNLILPFLSYFSFVTKVNHSDAIVDVNKKYDTESEVRDALDADCTSLADSDDQAKCERLEDSLVDYILQNNLKGTASPIGGGGGLRSFRQFRFKAAHTAVYIAEIHTSLSKLFDVLNSEGSNLGFIIFYDVGYANDDKSLLFDESKFSNGAGISFTKNNNSINLVAAGGSDDSRSWSLGFGTAF